MPKDHTGVNFAEAIEAALSLWDLDAANKIYLTTRLFCFRHNLHLSVTKAIQDDSHCSRALGVYRKIISSFSMSWKWKRELTKTPQLEVTFIDSCKYNKTYNLIYKLYI